MRRVVCSWRREGFVIGFWSNLKDEIRRNGCVLEVRMTTETHNVRAHWTGGEIQQQRKAALTENGLSRKQGAEDGKARRARSEWAEQSASSWSASEAGRPHLAALLPPPTHIPFPTGEFIPCLSPVSPYLGSSALLPAGSRVLWAHVLWQWLSSPISNHALRDLPTHNCGNSHP